MSRSFAIRVDAATHIGSGHLMRCLTLAQQLRSQGGRVYFITRPHTGHLNTYIQNNRFEVFELAPPTTPSPTQLHSTELYGASWLGATWQEDAEQTLAILQSNCVDELIVDHYGLDRRFEKTVSSTVKRLTVIDDLANRPHVCDRLLDQTLGREPSHYLPYTPAETTLLLGPHYALLRPEFASQRADSLKRREAGVLQHLLISLGGTDAENHTEQLLDALALLPQASELTLTVIMGEQAPHRDQVAKKIESLPMKAHFFCGVNNMAEHLLRADLAIGAAGSSAWERCCMGVPTLQVVLAPNQATSAQQLVAHHAALSLAPPYSHALKALWPQLTPDRLRHLSRFAAQLTNGEGAQRVATALMGNRSSFSNSP